MSVRRGIWIVCALLAAGCGPKAQLRDDPFNPRSAQRRPPAPRDSSRDVSTSPATDRGSRRDDPPPAYADRDDDEDADRRDERDRDDPFLAAGDREKQDREDDGGRRPAVGQFASRNPEPTPATPTSGTPANAEAEYASVRRRLENAGVKNFRSEIDEATGESFFRCEVPHRNDPNVIRVFEARHKDELKAMTAVTESVEQWQRSSR